MKPDFSQNRNNILIVFLTGVFIKSNLTLNEPSCRYICGLMFNSSNHSLQMIPKRPLYFEKIQDNILNMFNEFPRHMSNSSFRKKRLIIFYKLWGIPNAAQWIHFFTNDSVFIFFVEFLFKTPWKPRRQCIGLSKPLSSIKSRMHALFKAKHPIARKSGSIKSYPLTINNGPMSWYNAFS